MNPLQQLQVTLEESMLALPSVQFCGELPKRREALMTPAIILELAELTPDTEAGTGELGLLSHWEARVMMVEMDTNEAMYALVQAVFWVLYDHEWSAINVGRANIKAASRDHFSPEYPGHTIWLIEWTHRLRIGQNSWTGEGVVPTPLTFGESDRKTEIVRARVGTDEL